MFGKRKEKKIEREIDGANKVTNEILASWLGECNATAKMRIMEEMKILETRREPDFMKGYVTGLIDMAFNLQAITMNERSALKEMVHSKAEEARATEQPVYKKRGLYEYKKHYIVKVHNDGDGAANWAIRTIKKEAIIESDLTFKKAIALIDERTKK